MTGGDREFFFDLLFRFRDINSGERFEESIDLPEDLRRFRDSMVGVDDQHGIERIRSELRIVHVAVNHGDVFE